MTNEILPKHLWHPGLAHTSSIIDEFKWDQDAQNRRAEHETGGYGREMSSYFGRDGEGDAVEKRLNLKDYLKQHKAPEERDYENHSWSEGHRMGISHTLEGHRPHHADEFYQAADLTYSPEHFIRGYQTGAETAMPRERVAILVGDSADGMRIVAHVSGNSINVLHCPFCGSGAVIARSDGTIECGYCTSVFTVQVQPAYNGFPQSVDGQAYPWPGAPDPGDVLAPQPPAGTNLAPGVAPPGGMPPSGPPDSSDPADGDFGDDEESDDDNPFAKGGDDSNDSGSKNPFGKSKKSNDKDSDKKDDKKGNPFAKKKSYRTASGAELPVDEYLAHLAIQTARQPLQAALKVREARGRR